MSTTISGTNGVTFPDSTSMQTGQQACKAWVNFNGTGTVAIRGSYNVTSITDRATGKYTVNLITGMPDTNYSIVTGGSGNNGDYVGEAVQAYASSTTAIPVTTGSTSAYMDFPTVSVSVFR